MNISFLHKSITVVCCLFGIYATLGVAQQGPDENTTIQLGFERGKIGSLPAKWFVPTKGWKGELSDEQASDGKKSAKLSLPAKSDAPFGNLMMGMDARDYRGMTVRLSAKIRVEGEDASAMMWLRVDRPEKQMGFFDNMSDRPIVSSKWTEATIEGEVDADAERFALGVMSQGGGTVYVDEMKVVFLGRPTHSGCHSASASYGTRAGESGSSHPPAGLYSFFSSQ